MKPQFCATLSRAWSQWTRTDCKDNVIGNEGVILRSLRRPKNPEGSGSVIQFQYSLDSSLRSRPRPAFRMTQMWHLDIRTFLREDD